MRSSGLRAAFDGFCGGFALVSCLEPGWLCRLLEYFGCHLQASKTRLSHSRDCSSSQSGVCRRTCGSGPVTGGLIACYANCSTGRTRYRAFSGGRCGCLPSVHFLPDSLVVLFYRRINRRWRRMPGGFGCAGARLGLVRNRQAACALVDMLCMSGGHDKQPTQDDESVHDCPSPGSSQTTVAACGSSQSQAISQACHRR